MQHWLLVRQLPPEKLLLLQLLPLMKQPSLSSLLMELLTLVLLHPRLLGLLVAVKQVLLVVLIGRIMASRCS
jgi:hypothetical protein